MNEQNKFNPNNFNAQGDNSMPNNQPLNNQNFNTTFNQNVAPNNNVNQTTFNQQPINHQSQQTPSYEQPINHQSQQTPSYEQPINQGPSPQPMNSSFESDNDNNQNFNSKPQKKINLGLIIGIVGAVVAVIVGVIFIPKLLKGNESSNNGLIPNFKGTTISENDIKNYDLELDTIWINEPVGITYNIPKQVSGSMLNGSGGFNYIHGSSFAYYNGYDIYVDKSLEGHTNLETLASDIIGEKISDKYKFVYEFGSTLKTQFENVKTEKVKVGKIDTVYFESEELSTSSVVGNDLKLKLVGYSFKYNNEYISVYGEVLMEENNKMEELKQMLQYIINSIKEYNGESLQELGGNAKNYYDDGYTSSLCFNDCSKKYFTVNMLSNHTLNGVLRNYQEARDAVEEIDASKVNWDGTLEGILEATQNPKLYYNEYGKEYYPYYYSEFPWISWEQDGTNNWYNNKTVEILKEETIKINNVDMKKYLIKTFYQDGSGGCYIAVYTFIIDGVPYVVSYRLDSSVYSELNQIPNMTKEQSDIIIKQTETVADSFMKTFRILETEPYNNYLEMF